MGVDLMQLLQVSLSQGSCHFTYTDGASTANACVVLTAAVHRRTVCSCRTATCGATCVFGNVCNRNVRECPAIHQRRSDMARMASWKPVISLPMRARDPCAPYTS